MARVKERAIKRAIVRAKESNSVSQKTLKNK
jgi:hypothetical protein